MNEDLDSILKVIPLQLWDANYYYYWNYSSTFSIHHERNNFEFYVPLGDIGVPGDYYVATFEEHLMITRIGIVTEISRNLEDAIHLQSIFSKETIHTIQIQDECALLSTLICPAHLTNFMSTFVIQEELKG